MITLPPGRSPGAGIRSTRAAKIASFVAPSATQGAMKLRAAGPPTKVVLLQCLRGPGRSPCRPRRPPPWRRAIVVAASIAFDARSSARWTVSSGAIARPRAFGPPGSRLRSAQTQTHRRSSTAPLPVQTIRGAPWPTRGPGHRRQQGLGRRLDTPPHADLAHPASAIALGAFWARCDRNASWRSCRDAEAHPVGHVPRTVVVAVGTRTSSDRLTPHGLLPARNALPHAASP